MAYEDSGSMEVVGFGSHCTVNYIADSQVEKDSAVTDTIFDLVVERDVAE